ncbi:lung seven transmembrane receptor-domain-containing protein [Terfezia claveryi]|nr:lung seven transmembrane receptor-domain-containing protein [Terfezia claveryi]
MRRSLITGLLLAAGACLANAAEYLIDQEDGTRQQCAGMWSKKSWGGEIDPFIAVNFKAKPDSHGDKIVSLLIFEWEDANYLGRFPSEDSEERKYVCDSDAVKLNLCNETETGQFIVSPDANASSAGTIFTTAVNLKAPTPLKYNVVKTGYYCVQTYHSMAVKYEAVAVFQNAYGELPGSQIAKLPFYGGLTVVYALVAVLWAFLYVQHRVDILPVQNYITAIIIFLIIEMLITWAFYDYTNNYGNTLGSKILMIIVAILNAGRNSFSFFLLLIVCMGYGVVKPTLGKAMNLVRGLAIAHFIFGVIYSIASLTLSPDSAGPIVLLVILPLAATLTAFYVWTLNSLNLTMKELIERKQNVKSLMYKRLWWVLLSSIIVIFVFFFLNSLTFASHGSADFAPTHWKTRWFVLDGWLNLVYLVDLVVIAYIWRPTANNRRFAMSDELAQDDDGFEIASIGGSEDEDDLERRGSLERERGRVREGSSSVRRDSGEAIFSVGGEGDGSEDGWSEDEERKNLTRKRD